MALASAQKIQELSQAANAKDAHRKAAGDLSTIDIAGRYILVATFIRPEKIGSIIRPNTNLREDEYQSKVGLVLKKGPLAFSEDVDEGFKFGGMTAQEDDWVVYRVGDGWALNVNNTPCRMILDTQVRMKVQTPEVIF